VRGGQSPAANDFAATLDDVTLSASGSVSSVSDLLLGGETRREAFPQPQPWRLPRAWPRLTTVLSGSLDPATAAFSATLEDVALSASGSVAPLGAITSELTAALDDIGLSASGTLGALVPASGNLSAALDDVGLAAIGGTSITAALAATLDDVTLDAAVAPPPQVTRYTITADPRWLRINA
jgi:hypothetical protein